MAGFILSNEGSHVFNYTTTGAVTAGSLLIVGSTPMVALESAAAAGEKIACAVGAEAVLPKKAQAGGDLNSTEGKSAVGSNGDKSGITINYTNNQATEDRAGADIAGHLSSMQLAGAGG